MSGREITPAAFDRMAAAPARPKADRIIWTLAAIGARIGVGPDFVRDTLAKLPGSPVKEIGGRYYAFEDDLVQFLRTKDCNHQAHKADTDRRPPE